ncbi:MAG: YihY/virulence factor BrkB family protein [Salaquimonas sp.]|nr:YihY/virulence factor BrkB family protein [Salaquimonas sp.]
MLRPLRAAAGAVWRFGSDDGWAIASHITLSGLLALFPFLIFCASLAAFFDLGDFPDTVIHLVFDAWPESVAEPIAREVRAVLTEPRGDILTFGAVVALFFASNGVEALRLGLNRAYKVRETRNFVRLRIQSIVFVIGASLTVATVAIVLVLMPLALAIARKYSSGLVEEISRFGDWSLAVSGVVMIAALFAAHKWLPSGRRKFIEVAPGIALTLVLWLIASWAFAIYLKGFANYVSTYAGLAGVMITLIFVYYMSVIFLIGAEFNAVLNEERKNGSSKPPDR